MKKLTEEREAWVRQLRLSLLNQVHARGLSQRVLEEKNGFQRGYLSQVLKGRIQLTARHVFGLLLALEVEPAAFFLELFREQSTARQIAEIRERVERLEYDAGHPAEGRPVEGSEIEEAAEAEEAAPGDRSPVEEVERATGEGEGLEPRR